jgi:hypothetical protein
MASERSSPGTTVFASYLGSQRRCCKGRRSQRQPEFGTLLRGPVKVLVHIGYHKTGTSWLQHFVFEDPASGYGSVGHRAPTHLLRRLVGEHPLHYDRTAMRRDFERLIRKVEAQGLLAVVSLERLSESPYSGGNDSREFADRLHDALPNAGVLIVIREQRDISPLSTSNT